MTIDPTLPSLPILVVEDDRDSRDLLGDLLELEGFSVLLASDGLHALELLETAQPCLILLDLMMPRMNGSQFRTAQLEDARLRGIPVIVVSADGDAPRKAAEMGVEALVKKPVDIPVLLGAVHQYCRRI